MKIYEKKIQNNQKLNETTEKGRQSNQLNQKKRKKTQRNYWLSIFQYATISLIQKLIQFEKKNAAE